MSKAICQQCKNEAVELVQDQSIWKCSDCLSLVTKQKNIMRNPKKGVELIRIRRSTRGVWK